LNWPGSHGYDPAEMFNMNFERDMVTVRTAWIRCQMFPMQRDDAVRGGKLEMRVVPSGEPTQATDEAGNPITDEMGQPSMTQPTRQAYYFPGQYDNEATETVPDNEGDEGATMTHPQWPMRYGIRQVTIVGTTVIDDRECEWPEIPVVVNRNISIPF